MGMTLNIEECLSPEQRAAAGLGAPPQPPFLFVDLYPLDFDDPSTNVTEDPPWLELLADPRVFGIWLKSTDGVRWGYVDWFVRNIQALIALLGDRRGDTVLLGGYAFLQLTLPGGPQADYFLDAYAAAGLGDRDIVPVMDIELGGERHPNHRASAQQVVDCGSAFAERVRERTGRSTMLYGRGAQRDLGIGSRMGADRAANPSYTRTMVLNGLVPAFSLDEIPWWQYGGDGVGDVTATHLPLSITGHKVDLTVAIDGARKPTWERTRARLVESPFPA